MNLHRALLLLTLAASLPLSLAATATAADPAPKRVKRTCAQMREDMERISKKLKTPLQVTPGSWGDLPAPLRKLPAGAELCGVGSLGQVIILSPAFGKDLETHYAPLFAELGCKPLKCTIGPTTNCTCSAANAGGTVLADSAAETYSLMYLKTKK
jgi:hypothetical protein